jgi:hypothetical protein
MKNIPSDNSKRRKKNKNNIQINFKSSVYLMIQNILNSITRTEFS